MYILNFLIKKVDGCKNNLKKLLPIKIGKHIPCGYSMLTIWTFDGEENNPGIHRG